MRARRVVCGYQREVCVCVYAHVYSFVCCRPDQGSRPGSLPPPQILPGAATGVSDAAFSPPLHSSTSAALPHPPSSTPLPPPAARCVLHRYVALPPNPPCRSTRCHARRHARIMWERDPKKVREILSSYAVLRKRRAIFFKSPRLVRCFLFCFFL